MPWVSKKDLIEYIKQNTCNLTLSLLEEEINKYERRKKDDHVDDEVVFGLYDYSVPEWEYYIHDFE